MYDLSLMWYLNCSHCTVMVALATFNIQKHYKHIWTEDTSVMRLIFNNGLFLRWQWHWHLLYHKPGLGLLIESFLSYFPILSIIVVWIVKIKCCVLLYDDANIHSITLQSPIYQVGLRHQYLWPAFWMAGGYHVIKNTTTLKLLTLPSKQFRSAQIFIIN